MFRKISCLATIASIWLTASPLLAQDAQIYSSLFAAVDGLEPAINGSTELSLSDLQQILSLQGPGKNAYPDNARMPGVVPKYQSLHFEKAMFNDLQVDNLVVEIDRTTQRKVKRLSFHLDHPECIDSALIISKYQLNRAMGPDATPGASEIRYERNFNKGSIWLNAKTGADSRGILCATTMGLVFGPWRVAGISQWSDAP
jgi:hypothetical protein